MKQSPHDRLFSHFPLLQLAVAFSSGVLAASYAAVRLHILISIAATLSLLLIAAVIRKRLRFAGVLLLASFFLTGASLSLIQQQPPAANSIQQLLHDRSISEDQSLVLNGVINAPPEFARDRLHLILKVEMIERRDMSVRVSGDVALLATFKTNADKNDYHQLQLQYGSCVQVRTSLNRTDKYRNPGVSTLAEYLERRDLDANGTIKNPNDIVHLGDRPVFRPLAWLYRWRQRLQTEIDDRFSADTAGVLDAALLGNRFNLTKSASERFREAGTFHVLVISGLHISFIGGLVFLLAQKLTRKRWLQFLFSSVVVWGYTLAVGGEASVVRAALMFSFVALGGVVFRRASALNALGGSALVLLIKSPKDLFDPSLQLTFLSVLAIVAIAWPLLQTLRAIGSWRPTRDTPYPPVCAPLLRAVCESLFWSELEWKTELVRSPHSYRLFKTPIASWLERHHLQRGLRYMFNAIAVSLCVQLVLLPFLVIYFHRLSLSSLVLNIGVSFLLAVLSSVAALALLASQLSTTLAQPLFRLANMVDWLMVHSVDPFARFGVASIRLPDYSGRLTIVYVIYFFPVIVLIAALLRWRPLRLRTQKHTSVFLAVVAQILLIAIVISHPGSARGIDGQLHVDFLDVGQGDASLITMPNGSTLLVDAGGRPNFIQRNGDAPADLHERETRSIGETVVSEYLWWRGLDHLDFVLATHADADHIDGLNDVVRNFSVGSAFVGRTPGSDPEFVRFRQSLLETNTPLETIQAGDELHFGEVTIDVLWPLPTSDPNAASRNNDSVVLRVRYGERSLLLTGDIEKEGEAHLPQTDLRVDVVKVAHHGSRTSSTEGFVSATRPRFAIISVGQTSMFGHPHREIVERWKSVGSEVLTTGACGTISVTTDGTNLSVTKFVQP